ncbi:MAG: hypothetical protein AB1631_26560 [Acidobacteriota bacterium]
MRKARDVAHAKGEKLMRTKIVVLFLIGFALSVIGFVHVFSKSRQEELAELNVAKDRGSINWYIRKAKLLGEKRVALPAFTGIPADIQSLDEAMTRFRVVLAEPTEKYTHMAGEWTLLTWYKFKVLEDLSSNSFEQCAGCGSSADVPDDLLPLNPDEIIVPISGGVLTVDGILLTQPSGVGVDFSEGSSLANISEDIMTFSSGVSVPQTHKRISEPKKFLLFLSPTSQGMIGKLSLGSIGAFSIDPVGQLIPLDRKPNLISQALNRFHISSVDDLKVYRQHIQKSR